VQRDVGCVREGIVSASRSRVIAVPYNMNNNWNEPDASREIAGIHSAVVSALTQPLVQWVWQGHEWIATTPPHRLMTTWRDHGLWGESPQRVRAATVFLDENRSPLAEMRLSISRELDWDSLLVVAWIIAHEFVCHAQQMPPRDGRPRTMPRKDCLFFEGWMDEVAHGLFEAHVVSESANVPDAGFVRRYAQQIAHAATSYRRNRYEMGLEDNPHQLARQWGLGAESARVLRRFFETGAAYEQEKTRRRASLAQLVNLSYRIQGATTSPEELRRIVDGCLLAGQSALSFMRAAQRARLLHLLTQPIPDSTVWIYEIESLCRTFPV
jgi:hypothetical protein